ncbi:MAG: heavy-metal-associated domain-containing protein [Candidatus Kapabacteria bacterium]|nr:heavy-metal-associated domain-containing protein [Ignavibacteriota bacterium]MCW5883613.1 heavy-metal-associated domain-containing protein [Candidatus Kapabacteria bacterium]
MKYIFVILSIIVLTYIADSQEIKSTIEIKTSAICEHCKENIEKALNKVAGVEKSNLDLDTKVATVKYDSTRTNVDELRNAISKAGYNADDVKRDGRAYKRLPKCCKAD